MTKYTAKDFENARFAESDRTGNYFIKNPYGDWIDQYGNPGVLLHVMIDCGARPVPTKPTLTDSEVGELVPIELPEEYLTGFIDGFERAGGTIIPDPEPTNTERLEALQRSWVAGHPVSGGKSLIEYLNDHGVIAPNVKDN